jgi:hypothetical protein
MQNQSIIPSSSNTPPSTPVAAAGNGEECPVCMEHQLFMICTPCGHSFCFKCITKVMNKNTSCPLCRTVLIDVPNMEEEEEEEYFEDETIETNEEEDEELCEVENVIERFEQKGFGIMDLMCIILERRSRTNLKYTNDYIDKITDEFHEMVDDMDNETYEMVCMKNEDVNVLMF